MRKVKPVCFYLPQFHSIPENDRWWGKGFTEWSLTREAIPLFKSHSQPISPHADVAYYDLTDPDVRRFQGELAKDHGVYGFCYYHYWFNGKQLLETPLELMLQDGYPDIPFCLCWANEPWTRTWSGEGASVLQPQEYGAVEEWQAHFEALLPFLGHKNAIRVSGHPILLIYRTGQIPRLEEMVAYWRALAVENGLPGLHLLSVLGNFADNRSVPSFLDGGVEHHPGLFNGRLEPLVLNKGSRIYSIEKLWGASLEVPRVHPVQYPGACVSWDNSPRVGESATVFIESSKEREASFLSAVAQRARDDKALAEPLVFFNAWNEWSEGAYLEPDERQGHRRLETFKKGFGGLSERFTPVPPFGEPIPSAPGIVGDCIDVDAINLIVTNGIKARKVLEIGCRNGETGNYAAAFLGCVQYDGWEPDSRCLKSAGARLHSVKKIEQNYLESDWREPPEDCLRYDLVLCSDFLTQACSPVKGLNNLRALVAPGGHALIGFFHAGYHRSIAMQQKRDIQTIDHPFRPGVRASGYSITQMRSFLEASGFDLLNIFRVFDPGAPTENALNTIGDGYNFSGKTDNNLSSEDIANLFCHRVFFLVVPRNNSEVKR